MTQPFTFAVTGTPRPQPRPRFIRGRAVSTADAKARLWRNAVEQAIRLNMRQSGRGDFPLSGPLRLVLRFTFECDVNDRIEGMPHIGKPDGDNLAKLVMDVMERTGVFHNDSQIGELEVSKHWRSRPGVVAVLARGDAAEPVRANAVVPGWLIPR